jgi:hypothetical protein
MVKAPLAMAATTRRGVATQNAFLCLGTQNLRADPRVRRGVNAAPHQRPVTDAVIMACPTSALPPLSTRRAAL